MTLEDRIAELEAEYARQREHIATRLERVRELEARLAKDSHNSSKPPSCDGLKRQLPRTRSLRRRPHQRGRLKQSPTRNLLERLWLGQDQVLAFLDDLTIPFDKTTRPSGTCGVLKTQQKVSGCFRSDAGGDAFARLRSYLSTLRKQGVALLDALRTLFTNRPLYPAWG